MVLTRKPAPAGVLVTVVFLPVAAGSFAVDLGVAVGLAAPAVLLIEVLEPVLVVAEEVVVVVLFGGMVPVVVGRVVEAVPVLAAPVVVVVLVAVPGEEVVAFAGAVVALAVLVPVVLVVPVVAGLTGVAVVLTTGLVVVARLGVVVFAGDETIFEAGAGRVGADLAPGRVAPQPTLRAVPLPAPVRAPVVPTLGGSGFFGSGSGSLNILVTALAFSSCDSTGTQLSFSMVSKLDRRNFRGFSGVLSSVR